MIPCTSTAVSYTHLDVYKRQEFIELFYIKYKESIDRIIEKQKKKKDKLDKRFDEMREKLSQYNENLTSEE